MVKLGVGLAPYRRRGAKRKLISQNPSGFKCYVPFREVIQTLNLQTDVESIEAPTETILSNVQGHSSTTPAPRNDDANLQEV